MCSTTGVTKLLFVRWYIRGVTKSLLFFVWGSNKGWGQTFVWGGGQEDGITFIVHNQKSNRGPVGGGGGSCFT